MNFLQKLESHTGGLLRIKSELYWYGGHGPDGVPGRICLLLDAAAPAALDAPSVPLDALDAPAAATLHGARLAAPAAAVLLLIDGCPQRVWVSQEDVELIT